MEQGHENRIGAVLGRFKRNAIAQVCASAIALAGVGHMATANAGDFGLDNDKGSAISTVATLDANPDVLKNVKPEALSDLAKTRAEVIAWFFDEYLPRWVAAASGQSGEAPAFILDYWGTPMHVTGLGQSFWCLTDKNILTFLEMNQRPLKAAGYSHTVVPDKRVFVYSAVGAAVEVIWSRRRADETEIQRVAVHFEIARGAKGWRVIGMQALAMDRPTLADVWPR